MSTLGKIVPTAPPLPADNQPAALTVAIAASTSSLVAAPVLAPANGVVAELAEPGKLERFTQVLQLAFDSADGILKTPDWTTQQQVLGVFFDDVVNLSRIQHAARGIALTLAAYKVTQPSQDIRLHKTEHTGGFSARSIDHSGTIPFLQANSLYYNVDSHWLSQSFSFAGPYVSSLKIATVPKAAGPLMIKIVNGIENALDSVEFARSVLLVIMASLIDERNHGKLPLEKPQNLSIDQTTALLKQHFLHGYQKNSPRLPQVAIYAIYQSILPTMDRYNGLELGPLERMKAANRKSGSVGDIDVNKNGNPFEAVEIKFKVLIDRTHVAEAIQKIKTASVQRYLILSTLGVAEGEAEEIENLTRNFRRSNGCEIIVNGVIDTIKYYLRLIDSPATFINFYTAQVEIDPDLGYEHRLAWNEVCAKRQQ
jgi:DNA (cytosine-5)-methyltransferase 1